MLDFGAVHIEWGTMLFQALIFLLLLAAVWKAAIKPLIAMMEKRQAEIETQIKTAEEKHEQAEKLLEEQRAALNEARDEAKAIIDRAKKQSESEGQKILDDAKERAERAVEQAKEEIETEREKAVASLRDEVAELSVMLASRVLEKEVDASNHKDEIEAFIKQAGDRV